MRISDWSSDVCSSDLSAIRSALLLPLQERLKPLLQGRGWRIAGGSGVRELVLRRCRVQVPALLAGAVFARSVEAFEHRREVLLDVIQIGRASCRGRVCQYV